MTERLGHIRLIWSRPLLPILRRIILAFLVLIVAGILGLAYGKFSYTTETHEVKLGSLELSVKDKQTVNVLVWAGVGAIVAGGFLLPWHKRS